MQSQEPWDDERWEDCPRGMIREMVLRRRLRRRQTLLVQTVAAIAIIAVLGIAVTLRERPQHQLTCHRTQQLFGPFVRGEVAPDLARQIRLHLEECPECGEKFRNLFGNAGEPLDQTANGLPVSRAVLVAKR